MKKFIRKILIYFAMFLIGNLALARLYIDQKIYDPYLAPMEERDWEQHQIVFLGDSHPYALPDQICKDYGVYNFSYPSDNFTDMHRKLKYLLASDMEIQAIYIPVGDHSFTEYRQSLNNNRLSILYGSGTGFLQTVDKTRSRVLRHLPLLDTGNSELIRMRFEAWIIPGNQKSQRPSWVNCTPERRLRMAERRYLQQVGPISRQLVNALELLMKTATRHGIKVYGVRFPLTPEYRRFIPPEAVSISDTLSIENLRIIDASGWINDDALFKDQDHLNRRGARVFLDRLFSLPDAANNQEGAE